MKVVERVVRLGMRKGWSRGVVDGNPPWLVIGALSLLWYLARRAMHPEPDVVFLEQLKPGETFRITQKATS